MNHMVNVKALGLLALFASGSFALAPLVQAAPGPKPEDRGNGNSAAENVQALNLSTAGTRNTAHGWFSLFSNTTGDDNTANGYQALFSNTTGFGNTATGSAALSSNTTGDGNTAYGYTALTNSTGFNNTANGYAALQHNTTGNFNTANGFGTLFSNTIGNYNTASGFDALLTNTTGNNNTASGSDALYSNSTGTDNTANGAGALYGNTTGSFNVAIGFNAGLGLSSASYVTCIGALVVAANVDHTTWISNVYGVATQSGTTAPVIVSADGQLGTVASSKRFKKDIATMEKTSEAILSLRPVTFHYKTDTKGTPQFGLIAEEVAKVNPALVLPDKEGKPYTVRYDAVNAMLLNEFLKEHRKVENLKNDFQATVAQQQKEIAALTATVKEQAAQIQKVSAQLEASKAAPQTVSNNQ